MCWSAVAVGCVVATGREMAIELSDACDKLAQSVCSVEVSAFFLSVFSLLILFDGVVTCVAIGSSVKLALFGKP